MAESYALRSLFFRLEAERAHEMALAGARFLGAVPGAGRLAGVRYRVDDPRLAVAAFGLEFSNPVGLAAGFDKDATAWRGLAGFGFGHIETGTVTPVRQEGNPIPRLHRIPEQHALLNSMGFPSVGAEVVRRRLRRRRRTGLVLGVNLGKARATPIANAAADYAALVWEFRGVADYLVVNVSSPNTPDLRRLQSRGYLTELLGLVVRRRDAGTPRPPILVKVSPDLDPAGLDDVLSAVESTGADGLIATNTTVDRSGVAARWAGESGGISGPPLAAASSAVVRRAFRAFAGRIPVVGVGGIDGPAAALEKIRAGASLVQVYTGLVYRGPGLVRAINRGILDELERTGAGNVAALVGVENG
jgi:dihydroorotate dehydrogenase